MKLTFVHISDLHFKPDLPEANELIATKFLTDLASQSKSYENLFLVFSGDIVNSGDSMGQYEAFEKFMTPGLDVAGLTKERRICIPGNHDVAQSALSPALIGGAFSYLTSEALFNDNIAKLCQTLLKDRFTHYSAFENRFAKYACCQTSQTGAGWILPDSIGVFCLNTAVCSYAGQPDINGDRSPDQNSLMVDTRLLHSWIRASDCRVRILVMHHPLDWLTEWSKSELEKIIADNFALVFTGHIHQGRATIVSRGRGGVVQCYAPPLFTRKGDTLGYSFTTYDSDTKAIEVSYRQWSNPANIFVLGSVLAGNDSGSVVFGSHVSSDFSSVVAQHAPEQLDTLGILTAEFEEATTCYSTKKYIWLDRDLSKTHECAPGSDSVVVIGQDELVKQPRSCIIRAPRQFGLTCLGRYLALAFYRESKCQSALLILDCLDTPGYKDKLLKYIAHRCSDLKITQKSVAGFILDNWLPDKTSRSILRELKQEFPNLPVFVLYSVDDMNQITSGLGPGEEANLETLYLWALTKTRIRELVRSYLKDHDDLDDNLVTRKVTDDIDALNMHRTPINCLLILKLTEQAFEDSPVNRTEMIGRVLYLLFYQYDKIPKYSIRPDLKDCEYALGYCAEYLMRANKSSFTRREFKEKVEEYCNRHTIDLDIEVLFAFLIAEKILVARGVEFVFRFSYWLYFFAAHRMHHDTDFAVFIFSDRRYSAYPEIVEFYAGIDRRRSDAVKILTSDLIAMNADFSKRTSIPWDFNPLADFQWAPTIEALASLKEEVNKGISESALPDVVKDSIADSGYSRAKPYDQALAKFIDESSFRQLVDAMRGAARALRNSDHVCPEAKMKLLEEVIHCWTRVCQIMVLLSPIIADRRSAYFEGIGFALGRGFDGVEALEDRWKLILNVIIDNIVDWYQGDISSKKMGALFSKYIRSHEGELGEIFLLLVMIRQRPQGWKAEVERFVLRENKNSFYLCRTFQALRGEFQTSFATEVTRQDLLTLASTAIARHQFGVKKPNKGTVAQFSEAIAKDIEEEKRAN